MNRLPPELIAEIAKYLPRKDKLSVRKSCARLNHAVYPLIPEIHKSDQCEIYQLYFQEIFKHEGFHADCLCLGAYIKRLEDTQHFNDVTDRALVHHFLKSRVSNDFQFKVDLEFDSSTDGNRSFHLFERATIGRVLFHYNNPFYLDDSKIQWATRLLTNCKVEQISLLFDRASLIHIDRIPDLLKHIQCEHVQFDLENTWKYNMIDPFKNEILIAQLCAAGMTNLAVVAVEHHRINYQGRTQNIAPEIDRWTSNDPTIWFDFDTILMFVAAGLRKIEIRGLSFVDEYEHKCREDIEGLEKMIDDFMRLLCQTGRKVEIRFYLQYSIRISQPRVISVPDCPTYSATVPKETSWPFRNAVIVIVPQE